MTCLRLEEGISTLLLVRLARSLPFELGCNSIRVISKLQKTKNLVFYEERSAEEGGVSDSIED